ncbi:MAG: VOC family protein, partial [Anaerolineae bacterium]|nr:VOC family protein [Anaerolineae bacterium]
YRDNFGFEIKEGKTNFFIGNIGQGRIEVMKHPLTDKCHLAIRVSDFEQAVAALQARGIALEEPLQTPPGMKAVFLKDPDPSGNLVHLLWIEE